MTGSSSLRGVYVWRRQRLQIYARGATYDDFSGQFFRIFQIIIFCFVVAVCDLVHDVKAMYDLP